MRAGRGDRVVYAIRGSGVEVGTGLVLDGDAQDWSLECVFMERLSEQYAAVISTPYVDEEHEQVRILRDSGSSVIASAGTRPASSMRFSVGPVMTLVRLRMVGGKGQGRTDGPWQTVPRGTRNVGPLTLFSRSGGYSCIHSLRVLVGQAVRMDLVPVVTASGEAMFYDLVGGVHLGAPGGSLEAVRHRDYL